MVSAFGDDDLQLFARHGQRGRAALVELLQQFDQIAGERRLTIRVERPERLQHRTVVGAEDLQPVLRRTLAEDEAASMPVTLH